MLHRIRKHTVSFKHAFDGIVWAFRTQPNYIVHGAFSILTISGGSYYQITYSEWLIVITLIFLGLAIETINTAIEVTLDCISLDRRNDIKIAKDVSAGAMLLFSIGAVIIACIIFIPKIF